MPCSFNAPTTSGQLASAFASGAPSVWAICAASKYAPTTVAGSDAVSPGASHAAVADEKDLGVRILDLVRRERQGCHAGIRRARLGDKCREIP